MHDPDQELNRKNWHQRTWVRITILLLLPLISVGLYVISVRIALRRPPYLPSEAPEAPATE